MLLSAYVKGVRYLKGLLKSNSLEKGKLYRKKN